MPTATRTNAKLIAYSPGGVHNGRYYTSTKVHAPHCWVVSRWTREGFTYKTMAANKLPASAGDCKFCGGRHY
jgi:hypothetical protein